MGNAVRNFSENTPPSLAGTALRARQQIALFEVLDDTHKHFVEAMRHHAQRAFSTFIQPLCDHRSLAFDVKEGQWQFRPLYSSSARSLAEFNETLLDSASYDRDVEVALATLNHPVTGMDGVCLGELMESYDPLYRSASHYLRVALKNPTQGDMELIRQSLDHLYKMNILTPKIEQAQVKSLLVDQAVTRGIQQQDGVCEHLIGSRAFMDRLNRDLRISFSRDLPPYPVQSQPNTGFWLNIQTGELTFI